MFCTELVLSTKDASDGHYSYDHQCSNCYVSSPVALEIHALTSRDQARGVVRWRVNMLYACYSPGVKKEPREKQ